jgi:DNA primase
MNLNELQRVSKVGRIEVNSSSDENSTKGTALLPMSTDIDTCALIAAAIESIDKVGPFDCSFHLDAIDDVRASKKEDIVKRAKEIKQKWSTNSVSEGDEMLKTVHENNSDKITTYGKSKLHCSTGVFDSPWIILVEGRADIINLLRAGYDNAIGIEGARIDESIKELCSEKDTIIAFLDGDRAGGFILKELKSVVHIDYELRADEGIEVEELTPKRVDEILSPVVKEITTSSKPATLQNEDDGQLSEVCKKIFPQINESLEAVALNSKEEEVFKVAISELVDKISGQSEIEYLILDGIITQRLLDAAKKADVKNIVGHRAAKLGDYDGIILKTFTELGIA